MTEEVRQKILQWIYDNHSHHEGSDRVELDMGSGEVTEHVDEYECFDGDKPYVNSLELEEFVKSL